VINLTKNDCRTRRKMGVWKRHATNQGTTRARCSGKEGCGRPLEGVEDVSVLDELEREGGVPLVANEGLGTCSGTMFDGGTPGCGGGGQY